MPVSTSGVGVRIIVRMADENKPNPLDDVAKGLGLLFRAAKTTVERLPTDKIEDIVTEGAKEVGRAIESVSGVIEREVLGKKPTTQPPPADGSSAASSDAHAHDHAAPHASDASTASSTQSQSQSQSQTSANADEKKDDAKPPTDDEPKGPRIA